MDDTLRRTRLGWQAICLFLVLLAIAYVATFFATSRVRVFTWPSRGNVENEARIFISKPLQEVFDP